MTHYDLAVIGTGSGNSIVDERFAGQKVAILERGTFGGTCLNVGCIPTKMFVYPADVARAAQHGPDLGVRSTSAGADWAAIRDRIFGRIDPIAAGGREYREGLANVDVFTGSARFTGPRTIDTGTGVEITADQVVIAAGSRAVIPDIPGLADVEHHTSDTIMRLSDFPARVGIIGGGFIAAEFAHVFSAYGAVVTQVHRGARLLTAEDDEVSERFTGLAGKQWDLRLSTTVTQVSRVADGIRLELDDGGPAVEVDALLLATGRTPNADQLGLDTAGIARDDAGRVVVDEHQHTSADGVWALGDISSPQQLKHVANQDARVVQHNVLHAGDRSAWRVSDHRFVPSAVFSHPQIASVGLTERDARAAGHDVRTVTQAYADVAYGWAMDDSGHFVKLVVDAAERTLLGAHLIGPQASVLIQPLITALSFGLPLEGLAWGQYWIHPALTEVVENALIAAESVSR